MRKFILALAIITQAEASDMSELNYSHSQKPISQIDELTRIKNIVAPTLLHIELIALFEDLQQFELGRFLLSNHGLNGKWTDYIIKTKGRNGTMHPLEQWILTKAPLCLATQQRCSIFIKLFTEFAKKKHFETKNFDLNVASIPSGYMDEFRRLSHIPRLLLNAIDIDTHSLQYVKNNFPKSQTFIYQQDAWSLHFDDELDLITSNGLNIYIEDEKKIIDLYRQFHKALKEDGKLIVSFITPPSQWKNYDPQDLKKQTALFRDIIQARWQHVRTQDQTVDYLETAGFKVEKIVYDDYEMFPTVVARK